jgi:hypothetical protein
MKAVGSASNDDAIIALTDELDIRAETAAGTLLWHLQGHEYEDTPHSDLDASSVCPTAQPGPR